ncbi:rhomboid family intramembrane serine protease [Tenacibaculum finnmarkense]|uniref:Rhomboid family intramembrane serine protease n=1 Tax=Tenacibaculum finnmarkense genomovar finnmarkense TaxID=1458503 RepID=A0AAP1RGB5_9FLAO|nr:rhomboid family intramembrane serine protease [Tenacibaculum finnmarkense]MBE7653072.1 rhomboid family intramembrane serine protease [Tenacibaculum finnmarkense genomovar finnmarkense]MBE7695373.1 rhomboid family intramembrane serine protease [Tenacibaculum finnmarkense genomovar finnmarkense]MCD8427483.1 rhomboid family intramembrane serine protease [Tenacibaculum finnmarkense genomovar finnmarkense]MCD8454812.1 rhomboid family intramembrane serine protease [Tenacibaculum finnmarkense genom
MAKITAAIKHLIIINVIMYFVPQLLNLDITNIFALHYTENEHFAIWQYVTHIFMHASPMHLLFNMYALWAFGTPLEQMWGKNKFIFFYFSAGIGAGLIYTLVNYYQFNGIYTQLIEQGISAIDIKNLLNTGQYNDTLITLSNQTMSEFYSLYHTPAVGASGAVYGILVAFGLLFPDAKLALIFFPVPIAAKYFIPIMIASDVFFGVTKYSIGNIAHFAHIGGAIIGFIIAWYWKKNQFKTH